MFEFRDILKNNVVGSSLVVYSNGKLVKYNYGYRSLKNNLKVEDDTIFRIASISKIIVAMAALKLMEEGKLDINQDLSDIFGFKIRNPKHPTVPLTTKMLMLHTSSIMDGFDDDDLSHSGIEKGYNGVNGKGYFVSLEDLLTNKNSKYYSSNTYSDFSPGENFIYSNFGTGILACVVEKCSGELFSKYVEENILNPLGLDASFRASNIKKQSQISDTFYYSKENIFETSRTGESFVENTYPHFTVGNNFRGPAGGLFISMEDLSKIMLVLMNDGSYKGLKILKKETIDLMLQMHYLGNREDYLAKGLQLKLIDSLKGVVLKGHTGSAYGVSSFMFFSKEDDFGVCFIANGGKYFSDLPGLNNIQSTVLNYCLDKYYTPKQRVVRVDFNGNASCNNRKILLNKSVVCDAGLKLDLIDIGNILGIIPRVKDSAVHLNGECIVLEDGLVSLDFVLNHLKINYKRSKDEYWIYL